MTFLFCSPRSLSLQQMLTGHLAGPGIVLSRGSAMQRDVEPCPGNVCAIIGGVGETQQTSK